MSTNPFLDFVEVKDKGTRGRIFIRNRGLSGSCIDMILAVPREVHIINLEKQDDTYIVKVVGRAGGKELAVVIDDSLEELAKKLNSFSFYGLTDRAVVEVGSQGSDAVSGETGGDSVPEVG